MANDLLNVGTWIDTNIPSKLMERFSVFIRKRNPELLLCDKEPMSFLAENLSAFNNSAESVIDV